MGNDIKYPSYRKIKNTSPEINRYFDDNYNTLLSLNKKVENNIDNLNENIKKLDNDIENNINNVENNINNINNSINNINSVVNRLPKKVTKFRIALTLFDNDIQYVHSTNVGSFYIPFNRIEEDTDQCVSFKTVNNIYYPEITIKEDGLYLISLELNGKNDARPTTGSGANTYYARTFMRSNYNGINNDSIINHRSYDAQPSAATNSIYNLGGTIFKYLYKGTKLTFFYSVNTTALQFKLYPIENNVLSKLYIYKIGDNKDNYCELYRDNYTFSRTGAGFLSPVDFSTFTVIEKGKNLSITPSGIVSGKHGYWLFNIEFYNTRSSTGDSVLAFWMGGNNNANPDVLIDVYERQYLFSYYNTCCGFGGIFLNKDDWPIIQLHIYVGASCNFTVDRATVRVCFIPANEVAFGEMIISGSGKYGYIGIKDDYYVHIKGVSGFTLGSTISEIETFTSTKIADNYNLVTREATSPYYTRFNIVEEGLYIIGMNMKMSTNASTRYKLYIKPDSYQYKYIFIDGNCNFSAGVSVTSYVRFKAIYFDVLGQYRFFGFGTGNIVGDSNWSKFLLFKIPIL